MVSGVFLCVVVFDIVGCYDVGIKKWVGGVFGLDLGW